MSTWLERFVITVLAAVAVAFFLYNPFHWSPTIKWSIIACIVLLAFIAGWIVESMRAAAEAPTTDTQGSGGRGGGGNAIGKGSQVIGGKGGKGGAFGRGGDGGGGDAVGEGAMVVGGDGGDASRIDGRGGNGGQSPLKKLPKEILEKFGLTGNEGYGQGGRGSNSPEYERRLRILGRLSAEFASAFPQDRMHSMPGVLMPPKPWLDKKLEELNESFRVEFIDHGTDFLMHDRK